MYFDYAAATEKQNEIENKVFSFTFLHAEVTKLHVIVSRAFASSFSKLNTNT